MKKNKGKISLKLMSLLPINKLGNIKELAGSSRVNEETITIKDTIVYKNKSIIIFSNIYTSIYISIYSPP